jgi:hypothetical protein
MKTATLRKLQIPSRLAALLESLVTSQQWAHPGAPRLGDRADLPSVLQRLAVNALKTDGAWQAWSCYDGVRLFVAEMSLELSRERGQPALKIRYYNDQGKLQKYSHWTQLTDGEWQQIAV